MEPNQHKTPTDHNALDAEAVSMAREVRKGTGRLLRVLRRMEDERSYEHLGYASLFVYCIKRLRMSRCEARLRMRAVKKMHEVPEILPALEDGSLTLTNLSEIMRILNPGNAKALLAAVANKSKFKTQEIVARHAPKPPEKSRIRKMPTPQSREQAVTPHADDIYKFIAMINGAAYADIKEALELTKRENPEGDPGVLLAAMAKQYVRELRKKRFGAAAANAESGQDSASQTPRSTKPSTDPTYLTNEVKRAVWERDGGQCTFVGKGVERRRCTSREFLEFDHITPRSQGGEGTVENTRLLCYPHHKLVTEQTFGHEFIEKKIAQRKAGKAKSVAAKQANEPPLARRTCVSAATKSSVLRGKSKSVSQTKPSKNAGARAGVAAKPER